MRQFAKLTTAALAVLLIAPGITGAVSNDGGIAGDVENEKVIRELYAEFTDAWNRHDVEGMGNYWALDGDHQEPDGRIAKGRAEVIELFRQEHAGPFRKSKLSLTIDGVWFASRDVALVTGDYSVQGIILPDGNKMAPRGGFLTSVLIRDRGTWQIAASRLMIPALVPYR